MDKHHELCSCSKCLPRALGGWIDSLGATTRSGEWQVFSTMTYRTKNYPWARGFPMSGAGRPNPEFAHNLFARLITHLEGELQARLDYVVADQFGAQMGRFHQHAILASPGLDAYPRKQIWEWLKEKAGWSRVLPFEKGAAYYISQYIGRDAHKCEWNVRIGNESPTPPVEVGRITTVSSAPVDKSLFHLGLSNRHR